MGKSHLSLHSAFWSMPQTDVVSAWRLVKMLPCLLGGQIGAFTCSKSIQTEGPCELWHSCYTSEYYPIDQQIGNQLSWPHALSMWDLQHEHTHVQTRKPKHQPQQYRLFYTVKEDMFHVQRHGSQVTPLSLPFANELKSRHGPDPEMIHSS